MHHAQALKLYSKSRVSLQEVMLRRDDHVIFDTLMQDQQRFRGWSAFKEATHHCLRGAMIQTVSQNWIREVENIFCVMECANAEKVTFSTYVLVEETEHWWENTLARMEAKGQTIT
ncbi:hypothetical protein CR513_56472, partial [Mucuna pruriens]